MDQNQPRLNGLDALLTETRQFKFFVASEEVDFDKLAVLNTSQLAEMKILGKDDAIPQEYVSWVDHQERDKELLSEVISRILLYIAPGKGFNPERINSWFRKGKLPYSEVGSVASMSALFSEVNKALKLYSKIEKEKSNVASLEKREKSLSERQLKSLERSSTSVESLEKELKKQNLIVVRKLKEVEAVLGSGGML